MILNYHPESECYFWAPELQPMCDPMAAHQVPLGEAVYAGPGTSTVIADMDFETYSPAGMWFDGQKWQPPKGVPATNKGLPGIGAAVYAEHPDTEVLSLKYDLKDGRGARGWVPGQPQPLDLFDYLASGGLVEAWNAAFEHWIWSRCCVPKYGFPPIRLDQMRCAMAKARAWALPGKLEKTGEVLALTIQKDADGKRLLDKFSKPRNPTKTSPSLRVKPEDDPADAARLYAYNQTDIEAEAEASARCPDLSPTELQVWKVDQRINYRGVQVDLKTARAFADILDQAYSRFNSELHQLTGGAVTAASEVQKLIGWLGAYGVHVAALDEDAVAEALKRPGLPAHCRRALEIRAAVGSASVKKIYSILNQADCDGRVHDMFVYHSARTGRWAATGLQPQNLPSGAGYRLRKCGDAVCGKHYGMPLAACPHCGAAEQFSSVVEWSPEAMREVIEFIGCGSLDLMLYTYGDAITVMSFCIRGMLVAAPGCDLISSDYSAIEAVVLAALAGEGWRLEVFRTHGKIYEASASRITGVPLEEYERYKRETGQHHPTRKTIGKPCELGLGYGGWVGALRAFGADEFFDSEDSMKKTILAWREASPSIVEFWGGQFRGKPWMPGYRPELYGLEGCAIAAVQHPGQAFTHRGIAWQMLEDALYCRLPSGRLLTYHRPRLEPSERGGLSLSYEGWNTNPKNGPTGWIRIYTHGGKLTENAVQAVARDILAHALVQLEAIGYRVVLHVHDEVVVEMLEGAGSIEELEAIMADVPDWARGWPIKAAGGWRGKRYCKG